MDLQFAHIEYSIQTKSIDIYNIGCFGSCVGCCNPELKDWNQRGIDSAQVISKVVELNNKFDSLVDRIILVGGDPVDAYSCYPEQYLEFVRNLPNKPIYLFTRHELKDVPVELIEEVDYVKTGAYNPEWEVDNNVQYGIKLATHNQKIYKVDEDLISGLTN